MNYSRGDIVIVPFPFVLSGGRKIQKARPALVISDMTLERRYNDLILASITSQIPDDLKETEIIIEPTPANGLLKKSSLRLEFLMTVPSELISRKIGQLKPQEIKDVDLKITRSLGLSK
jgi:mRNA-degrading endonuclease toxin of MazEF toxin-antitoxin module